MHKLLQKNLGMCLQQEKAGLGGQMSDNIILQRVIFVNFQNRKFVLK
jgi:hypothetical protein